VAITGEDDVTEDGNDRTMEELQNWQESDRKCPECGSLLLVGSWWDDHPNNGGANIGELVDCTNESCDYFDSF
jgi:hypothetical protein